jgi:hypothetical protein
MAGASGIFSDGNAAHDGLSVIVNIQRCDSNAAFIELQEKLNAIERLAVIAATVAILKMRVVLFVVFQLEQGHLHNFVELLPLRA